MRVIDLTLKRVSIGKATRQRGLTMFALVSSGATDGFGCLTLEEASAQGLCEVSEVSEAGSVPELLFKNLGDKTIPLLDGDELVGARQNRVVNISILIAPHAAIVIPVSCVERGRWRYTSRDLRPSGKKLFAAARAQAMQTVAMSAKAGRGLRADQRAVWDSVEEKLGALRVDSETDALHAAYELSSAALEPFIAALEPSPGQVGAVFVVGGRIAGMELFASAELLAKSLARTVESFALGAMGLDNPEEGILPATAHTFLAEVLAASRAEYETVGAGTGLHLDAPGLTGAALISGDSLVHLAAFRVQFQP